MSSASPTPARPPARTLARRAGETALLAAAVLLLVLVAAEWRPLMDADESVVRTWHDWALEYDQLTAVQRLLSDWVWDTWTLRALCAAVVLWLLRYRGWRPALWLGLTCLGGALVQQALKAAVDRPRPVLPRPVDHAHYAAFPSGHAMTATVVCGALLWLLHHYGASGTVRRWALIGAVVSVLGVGVTRVWLGVHWPTDVLGGWLLGTLAVLTAGALGSRLLGERTRG
ncbi:phosphatase PAP2 family protein [Streptomyces sp. SCSIO ZS0520]|uniref:phosphatase PAP2 family protein n=1 Tax=Streptomyces sp. SCSIO ZS0520 TaxID=2892996 RepID=UPI0021DB76C5|nr:phosphatase PAP2 family protein [Streptomyces sp. SCSIO ZS0520]